MPALPVVARIGFADACRRKCGALGLAAGDVERRQAALAGDLPDMRMVDDDQIVGARQILDGKDSKSCSERLSQAISTPVFSFQIAEQATIGS